MNRAVVDTYFATGYLLTNTLRYPGTRLGVACSKFHVLSWSGI